MRAISLVCFLLVGSISQASLVEFRVRNRKSVFCATLLKATRTLGYATRDNSARDLFRSFREKVLDARPVMDTDAQPALNVRSTVRKIPREALIKRVYGVERAFQVPDRADRFVVGSMSAHGDERIAQFTGFLQLAEDELYKQAKLTFRPSFLGIPKGVIDLFQYEGYGPLMAFHAALFTFESLAILSNGLLMPGSLPHKLNAFGLVAMFGLAGSFDYPIRHIRSYERGRARLTRAIAKAQKQGDDWLYWSRDLIVSGEFVEALLKDDPIHWENTLRDEDYREQRSGLYKIFRERQRRARGNKDVRFSIDVLYVRGDGEPDLSVVLRSQPANLPARETQSAPLGQTVTEH